MDPDRIDIATFTVTNYHGDAKQMFGVDSTNGQLSIIQSGLSYSTRSSYTYTVRVTDKGGLWAESQVNITVIPVPIAPVFGSIPNGGIAENVPMHPLTYLGSSDTMAGMQMLYMSTDGNSDSLEWAIISIDGDVSKRHYLQVQPVTSTTMEISLNHTFDYEIQNLYSVNISVSDGPVHLFHGGHTIYTTFDLLIFNRNDNPTIPRTALCAMSLHDQNGSEVCSIMGHDEDAISDAGGWGVITYHLVYSPVSFISVRNSFKGATLYLNTHTLPTVAYDIKNIMVMVIDGGGKKIMNAIMGTL